MELELNKLKKESVSDASKRSNGSSSLTLPRLLFFQKQGLGSSSGSGSNTNSRSDSILPIQLIYPSGKLSLGVPLNSKSSTNQENETDDGLVTITSMPENTDDDKSHRNGLRFMFIVTAVFNIIITILMYDYATTVDSSRVETSQGPSTIFGVVPKERTKNEQLGYAFTILITLFGISASYFESSFGLSIYNYSIAVNFILGITTLPYLGYGFRYFLDLLMVYLVFVHKEHLETAYLPIHIHAF